VNIAHGKYVQAMLFAMKEDFNLPYTNITIDDLLGILDSGCSIAITPNLGNFIAGTYQPQEHTIKGIGSGLSSLHASETSIGN
jgi:hypothetical protein